MNKQTNKQTNRQMNKQTNERTNKQNDTKLLTTNKEQKIVNNEV